MSDEFEQGRQSVEVEINGQKVWKGMDFAKVKRSDLEDLVQSTWQSWANSNSGLAKPVMLALERAVELAGGEIEEDSGE